MELLLSSDLPSLPAGLRSRNLRNASLRTLQSIPVRSGGESGVILELPVMQALHASASLVCVCVIHAWKTHLKRLIFSLSMRVWQLPLADAAIWVQHRWLISGSHKNCTVKTQIFLLCWAQRPARWNLFHYFLWPPGSFSCESTFHLLTTWHSFGRPVWICMEERNSFHGDADPSLSFSFLRAAPLPLTPSTCGRPPESVWFYYVPRAEPGSRHVDIGKCILLCVRTVTLHLVTPHSVITSTNAEYAWLHS